MSANPYRSIEACKTCRGKGTVGGGWDGMGGSDEPSLCPDCLGDNVGSVVRDLQAQLEAECVEVERLRALLHRDQTGLAEAIARMVKGASGRLWVAEGRGCYEWDDDRYKEEAGDALRSIIAIGKKALAESGTRADVAFHASHAAHERAPS